jgi:hypothetical protein
MILCYRGPGKAIQNSVRKTKPETGRVTQVEEYLSSNLSNAREREREREKEKKNKTKEQTVMENKDFLLWISNPSL